MKTKVLVALFGALVLATGCVGTVSGNKTAGVPFESDKVVDRYERSPEAIFNAAKDVVRENGVLINESVVYGDTTATNQYQTVHGKVNQSNVWVRIGAVDPKVTEVAVQARNRAGGADIAVAHEISKQIALKLVSR